MKHGVFMQTLTHDNSNLVTTYNKIEVTEAKFVQITGKLPLKIKITVKSVSSNTKGYKRVADIAWINQNTITIKIKHPNNC